MTEKELMLEGKLFTTKNEELQSYKIKRSAALDNFNNAGYYDYETREAICRSLFGSIGKNFRVCKPMYFDYGFNIFIGDNFYANTDCIFLDSNKIIIGNNVFLAPRVSIFTANHPIDAGVRKRHLEYGKPVVIGDDVWIGGNTVINPGVTIGSNVVIGSGSVVVKDIPSDSLAAGNPCRVIRPITTEDKKYWESLEEEHKMNTF